MPRLPEVYQGQIIDDPKLLCPECMDQGVVFKGKTPAGLGTHRFRMHKVLGTSSTARGRQVQRAALAKPVVLKPATKATTTLRVPESEALQRLREFVDHLPIEYLECRQYNHAWTGHTVQSGRDGFQVTLRCLRCQSQATESLTRDGSRDGKRHIHYVEGYLARGMGRLTGRGRDIVRLAGVNRHLPG